MKNNVECRVEKLIKKTNQILKKKKQIPIQFNIN